jgi:ectoine hydroxylase-related dioxygenase (phytanoyl-CoA dioxygenase family)
MLGRVDGVPGFGVWSVKAGQDYCEAPAEVLRRIVALRLHLDPCGPDNGPLRVIPGSHGDGRLTTEQIESWKSNNAAVTVCAEAGDVLAMSPLLLHASSPATLPNHRRVLHVEYAAGSLPGGLQWASVG